jgi:hypothetical protein
MVSKIENGAELEEEVLVTEEFEKLLFMALFVPFVR